MTDIIVPQLGESVTEATVGQWLKQAGDSVSKDEVLVELETDKVSVEVSAPEDGTLSEIAASEGDTVEIGALLGRIGEGSGVAAASPVAAAPVATQPATAPANGTSGGAIVDVAVPTMGESVSEGTLGSFAKQPGDTVSKDETIAEIETDKVALDVPAPADGTLIEWLVTEGDSVTPGAVIARVAVGEGAAVVSATPAAAAPASAAAPSANGVTGERPVSPSVRRVAAEAGVNPADIPGTGRDGRATKADAIAYLNRDRSGEKVSEPKPPRDLEPREERVRMTRLRQTIARRLKEAQDTAAMLTTFNDVDMGPIMALRKANKDAFLEKHGVKLGFMGFFTLACVQALKEIPAVNAEIDGTDIIYKNYYNVGMAVGTDKGLVVPVVRDVDTLNLAGVESELATLAAKARDGDLAMADLQGGTFTITNGGVYGSLMSTPILNPPQSGVLGMHRIEERPVVQDGEIVIRPMMYLALSYDHRIVDGKEAVTFLVRVKEELENPQAMLDAAMA